MQKVGNARREIKNKRGSSGTISSAESFRNPGVEVHKLQQINTTVVLKAVGVNRGSGSRGEGERERDKGSEREREKQMVNISQSKIHPVCQQLGFYRQTLSHIKSTRSLKPHRARTTLCLLSEKLIFECKDSQEAVQSAAHAAGNRVGSVLFGRAARDSSSCHTASGG